MPRPRRARDAAQKAARRDEILDAAGALFDDHPTAAVPMARVAEHAGLAKGTLYLYFPTKEALFISLLGRELEAWFADMNEALHEVPNGGGTPSSLARLLVESVKERRRFLGLLALLTGVLEHNIDEETAATWKLGIAVHVLTTGPLVEAYLPGLERGTGARLVAWLNALVVGLWPVSHPAPPVAAALERPELAPLRIDFETEAEALLTALITGLVTR